MNTTNNYSNVNITGNISSNSSSNETTNLGQQWDVLTIVSLITAITGIFGNGVLLIPFIMDRAVRTPFNIYVINLLIANLSCAIIQYPMDFISNLHAGAWLLGEVWCGIYLYCIWILEAVICNSHQLIAINRIWAVSHPVSYRNHHSIRTAIFLCLFVWVYCHVGIGVVVVNDLLYYHLPTETSGCMVNPDMQFTGIAFVEVLFVLPEVVMIMAFPIIYFAEKTKRKRMRGQMNAVAPILVVVTLPTNPSGGNSTANSNIPALPAAVPTTTRRSPGFLLLALLTISVIICWTPDIAYYFYSLVSQSVDSFSPIFYTIQAISFTLQTSIDPILFCLALPNLRIALMGIFCRRRAIMIV